MIFLRGYVMGSELNDHLEKIHEYRGTDFRWCNLRTMVKKYIRGKKILDAGCGTGHLSLDLLKENYDVTAIDSSNELVDYAQENIRNAGYDADILPCDLVSLKNRNFSPFDSIVCLDVIEHISNDDVVLDNFSDILKNGGTLIISVPAKKYFYGERDKKVGHYRRYEKKELAGKLKKAGFIISDLRYWNFIGVVPYIISEKLLHKPLNEDIRYSGNKTGAKIFNIMLNYWFALIENRVRLPIGLTIIAVCKKIS